MAAAWVLRVVGTRVHKEVLPFVMLALLSRPSPASRRSAGGPGRKPVEGEPLTPGIATLVAPLRLARPLLQVMLRSSMVEPLRSAMIAGAVPALEPLKS